MFYFMSIRFSMLSKVSEIIEVFRFTYDIDVSLTDY